MRSRIEYRWRTKAPLALISAGNSPVFALMERFHSLALGPHPQRELTLMPSPRISMSSARHGRRRNHSFTGRRGLTRGRLILSSCPAFAFERDAIERAGGDRRRASHKTDETANAQIPMN